MTPLDWFSELWEIKARGSAYRPKTQLDALSAYGSTLVQLDNDELGHALKTGDLDAGTVFRMLKYYVVLDYISPKGLVRSGGDNRLSTRFDKYVSDYIQKTGWSLSANATNTHWLFEMLERPDNMAKHPAWFETVANKHPWAWEPMFLEQLHTSADTQCRPYLYDTMKKPWETLRMVEQLLIWMSSQGEAPSQKSALCNAAWPQWMAHATGCMNIYQQLHGHPEPSNKPSSPLCSRYFREMAQTTLSTWKATPEEVWDVPEVWEL